MEVRRTKHAAYCLKYHLVWIPKYRDRTLSKEVSGYLKEVFERIAEEYEFGIDTMEVIEDHVHIFVEGPPKYSPAHVLQILTSVPGHEVSNKFPKLRKQLWAGGFWSDGYYVRSVGDKVTADIIRKYIEYQINKQHSLQLRMFEKS